MGVALVKQLAVFLALEVYRTLTGSGYLIIERHSQG
jgi:hypothetical protein